MPEICRFYGMIIKMYFRKKEHNPPHIHILYGEYLGVIDIETLEVAEGDLPKRAEKMAIEWVEKYQKELLDIWNTQNFVKLPPLE